MRSGMAAAGAAAVVGGLAAAALAGGTFARMDPDPAFLKEGATRKFRVVYTGRLKEIPVETRRLRIWLPVPRDTAVQTVTDLEFEGGPPKITTEKRFGNRLAHWEVENPVGAIRLVPGARTFDWTVAMSFTCVRKEQVTDLEKLAGDGTENDPAAAEFLKDDRLTVVDDEVRKMAAEATAGRKTTLEKARGLYDAVAKRMTYDKTGTGWGLGDTRHAYESCRGNCTDFHALFMSLCRASGIPAGFEIGLYLPYAKGSDEKLGGYHCWSFFRVPGKAWVPVDLSEADRNPDRYEYFFGSHTPNRVTLSVGRDLVLEPAQAGEPLNYLLNPYAEADGKPVATSKDWTAKDLE